MLNFRGVPLETYPRPESPAVYLWEFLNHLGGGFGMPKRWCVVGSLVVLLD